MNSQTRVYENLQKTRCHYDYLPLQPKIPLLAAAHHEEVRPPQSLGEPNYKPIDDSSEIEDEDAHRAQGIQS